MCGLVSNVNNKMPVTRDDAPVAQSGRVPRRHRRRQEVAEERRSLRPDWTRV